MDADEFKQIAIEVFGNGWSHKLAYRLNINRSTVREYATGRKSVPDAIAAMMRHYQGGLYRGL